MSKERERIDRAQANIFVSRSSGWNAVLVIELRSEANLSVTQTLLAHTGRLALLTQQVVAMIESSSCAEPTNSVSISHLGEVVKLHLARSGAGSLSLSSEVP